MRISVPSIAHVFVSLNEDLIMESNYTFCIFENLFVNNYNKDLNMLPCTCICTIN